MASVKHCRGTTLSWLPSLLLMAVLAAWMTRELSRNRQLQHDGPLTSRHLQSTFIACRYGTQPGYWNLTAPPGKKYKAVDPSCAMQNYIQAALDIAGRPVRPIRILFISDSLDLKKMQDYQERYADAAHLDTHHKTKMLLGTSEPGFGSTGWPSGSKHHKTAFDYVRGSNVSTYLHMALRYMPGVHPHGPYLANVSCDNSWKNTVGPDIKLVKTWFGDNPDLVVVGSNLWDLARIYTYEHHYWRDHRAEGMPEELMRGYMANLTHMIMYTRSKLPKETPMYFRTNPFPHFNYTSGMCEVEHQTSLQWISTLTSAGKVVAEQMGLDVLDEANILSHFSANLTIRDRHHPKDWCNMETMNVMLNMLARDKPELFKGWPLTDEQLTASD